MNTPERSAPSELSVSHHCLLRRLRCQQPADRCQCQHHHRSNQIHCHRPCCQSDFWQSNPWPDWSARRHLLCFAYPSKSARSTIELHRLRWHLDSVMGAAIFDFFAKHEASTTFVPHTRLSTKYVSKSWSKVHLYISRTNCGSTKYCNHFSTINYTPIQLQLFRNNSHELPMRTQTMATVFMRTGAGEIRT